MKDFGSTTSNREVLHLNTPVSLSSVLLRKHFWTYHLGLHLIPGTNYYFIVITM